MNESLETSELSFVLKPSNIDGVGVFAAHPITKGTPLKLFEDNDTVRILATTDIPDYFKRYCLELNGELHAPANFSRMSVGWYLNHSEEPNVAHENYQYFALTDIKAHEEITINYATVDDSNEHA